MNLKIKLIGGMFLVLIVSVVFIVYGQIGSQAVQDHSKSILNNTYPALEKSNQIVEIVRETTENIVNGFDSTEDHDQIKDEINNIKNNLVNFHLIFNSIVDDKFKTKLQIIKRDYLEYSQTGIKVLESSMKENADDIDSEKIFELTKRLLDNLSDYSNSKKNQMTSELKNIDDQAGDFKKLFLNVGWFLILVVLFIVTVVLLTIQAINGLVISAKFLAEGRLESEIIINRTDELGVLQTTFEHMRLSLRDHIANLDNKVQEKTVEISNQMVTLQNTTDVLEHSENKIRSIIESAFDAIIMTNREGEIEEFNPAAAKLFSKSEDEMIGKNIHDSILQDEHAHLFNSSVKKDFLEPTHVNELIETKFSQDNSENSFWADIYITVVDSGNKNISYVYFIRDISERINATIVEKNLQKQLLEASRHAGKAEIATSVLHNVGNVLNSINSSASAMREVLSNSRLSSYHQICEIITNNIGNIGEFISTDPKGKVIPEYLLKLSDVLSDEHEHLNKEMERVTVNINHIVEIVKSQQSFAGHSNVFEELQISDIFEDSIQINKASLDRHGVEVIRDIPGDLTYIVDRHKLIQILTNLISNAKHALKHVETDKAKIYCSAEKMSNGSLVMQVRDNGAGIKEENLKSLFTYGFTTKKEGHGFGLHSCVLAAKDMGGEMTVESDGENQGACFTIILQPNDILN
ncbi:MAG: hypothetical protein COA79_06340 [Planctomycetota bacterium]|nr:MAG: hypothetical protein COA79_06340 [Planctomycetota bacterium]